MANVITIPFNFEPVDNLEDSTSYTVGSGGGDYAIVNVTLSADAVGNGAMAAVTNGTGYGSANCSSTTIKMELKNGAVLTKTETPASGTTGAVASGSVASTSIATVLVDGVAAGTVRATASAGHVAVGTTATSTVSGTADVEWQIAEYTSITQERI